MTFRPPSLRFISRVLGSVRPELMAPVPMSTLGVFLCRTCNDFMQDKSLFIFDTRFCLQLIVCRDMEGAGILSFKHLLRSKFV